MSISRRIKSIRKDLNLSQKEFAEVLGVKQGVVSHMEKSRTSPTIRHLATLHEVYGISADWLLFGSGETESQPPS